MSRDRFSAAVARIGPALLHSLAGLETARRRLHPAAMAPVVAALQPLAAELDDARAQLRRTPAPVELEAFGARLGEAGDRAADALERFTAPGGDVGQILLGMHLHHRAEAALYPLRHVLPPVRRFYIEEAFADRLAMLDPDPPAPGAWPPPAAAHWPAWTRIRQTGRPAGKDPRSPQRPGRRPIL